VQRREEGAINMKLSKEQFVNIVIAHQKARKKKRKLNEMQLNNYQSDNHFRIVRRCK